MTISKKTIAKTAPVETVSVKTSKVTTRKEAPVEKAVKAPVKKTVAVKAPVKAATVIETVKIQPIVSKPNVTKHTARSSGFEKISFEEAVRLSKL